MPVMKVKSVVFFVLFFLNFAKIRYIFSRLTYIHHNMSNPFSTVLPEFAHSSIAGIYSTTYIFYYLFVHGYIPLCEA